MLFQKILLVLIGLGFLACAAAGVVYDIYLALGLDRILERGERCAERAQNGRSSALQPAPRPLWRRGAVKWNMAAQLAAEKGTARS